MPWKQFIFFTIIITLLTSCAPRESKPHRLSQFLEVLNDQGIIKEFKEGNTTAVADFIDQNCEKDATFKKKYEATKTHEGIDFFSTYETAEFFYKHFYKKTVK